MTTRSSMDQKKELVEKNQARVKTRFEIHGEELLEKRVKHSGNSGRIYLPPAWVGKTVKIIRID